MVITKWPIVGCVLCLERPQDTAFEFSPALGQGLLRLQDRNFTPLQAKKRAEVAVASSGESVVSTAFSWANKVPSLPERKTKLFLPQKCCQEK